MTNPHPPLFFPRTSIESVEEGNHLAPKFDGNGLIPLLTGHDESTRTPGLFLVGPQVRHPGEIFCFIYKFRTRFPSVAQQISARLNQPARERIPTVGNV